MASDLISRKALLDLYDGLEGKGLRIPIDVLILNIEDMPTVDAVEVVHGEWSEEVDTADCEYIECSVCGSMFYDGDNDTFDRLYNYCPNCGADMRKGRWKGEGMGDFSCSLCGEVVSGNHREKCPNCHAKMDGGDK